MIISLYSVTLTLLIIILHCFNCFCRTIAEPIQPKSALKHSYTTISLMFYRWFLIALYFENIDCRFRSLPPSKNQNFLNAIQQGCFLFLKHPNFQILFPQELLPASKLKRNKKGTSFGIEPRILVGIHINNRMGKQN